MNPARARPATMENSPTMIATIIDRSTRRCGSPAASGGDGGGDHRRGRRVGAYHQLPRAADQGVDQHRQDARIEAYLGREAGDLGVSDGGGDLDCRYRQPGLDIRTEPGAAVVEQAIESGYPAGEWHAADSLQARMPQLSPKDRLQDCRESLFLQCTRSSRRGAIRRFFAPAADLRPSTPTCRSFPR